LLTAEQPLPQQLVWQAICSFHHRKNKAGQNADQGHSSSLCLCGVTLSFQIFFVTLLDRVCERSMHEIISATP
jgi:hypothetical protein